LLTKDYRVDDFVRKEQTGVKVVDANILEEKNLRLVGN
jgi:hypothetical protein